MLLDMYVRRKGDTPRFCRPCTTNEDATQKQVAVNRLRRAMRVAMVTKRAAASTGGGSPLSENIDALSEEILSEVAELKQWVRSHRVAMGSGATTISPASLAAMS